MPMRRTVRAVLITAILWSVAWMILPIIGMFGLRGNGESAWSLVASVITILPQMVRGAVLNGGLAGVFFATLLAVGARGRASPSHIPIWRVGLFGMIAGLLMAAVLTRGGAGVSAILWAGVFGGALALLQVGVARRASRASHDLPDDVAEQRRLGEPQVESPTAGRRAPREGSRIASRTSRPNQSGASSAPPMRTQW